MDPLGYTVRTKHVFEDPLIDGSNNLLHLIRIKTYGTMFNEAFNFTDNLLGLRRGSL